MKEWKCGKCGQWVSGAYMRHHHSELKSPTVEEMIAWRKQGNYALASQTLNMTTYTRDGTEPTREKRP